MFLFPITAVSAVGNLVDTPECLPTLSGFCAVIHAGWTSVRGVLEEVLLRLIDLKRYRHIKYYYLK